MRFVKENPVFCPQTRQFRPRGKGSAAPPVCGEGNAALPRRAAEKVSAPLSISALSLPPLFFSAAQLSRKLRAFVAELPPRLVDGDGDGIGKIQ